MQVTSWRPDVFVDGDWSANSLRFATQEEAAGYARDLYARWTLVTDWRTTETTDPVTTAWRTAGIEPDRTERGMI